MSGNLIGQGYTRIDVEAPEKQYTTNGQGSPFVECGPLHGCISTRPCPEYAISTGTYKCICDGILPSLQLNCTSVDVTCPTVSGFKLGTAYFPSKYSRESPNKPPFTVKCPYYFKESELTESDITAWQNQYGGETITNDVLVPIFCSQPQNLETSICKEYCSNGLCNNLIEYKCTGSELSSNTCIDYCFYTKPYSCNSKLRDYCGGMTSNIPDVCECFLDSVYYFTYVENRYSIIKHESLRKALIDAYSGQPYSCYYKPCQQSAYKPDDSYNCTDELLLCLHNIDIESDGTLKPNNFATKECIKTVKDFIAPYLPPPPPPPSPSTAVTTTKGKSNTGLIVGIIIGILVFLAVVGFIIYFLTRKKKKT